MRERHSERGARGRVRGVTAVELLAGLGTVGVLALAATLLIVRSGANQDLSQAQADAGRILEATKAWHEEHAEEGGCPTVSVLVHESILGEEVPTADPWGGKFRVQCDGDRLRVRSAGPDRRAGTHDDLEVARVHG